MNIGGINGAEQYIYNKMNYLKQKGYQVFIFSGRPEKILIDGFREYENLVNPALRFYPSCLSARECQKTVDWMVSVMDVQAADTCIIESSNVTSSLWGELIASKVQAQHLVVIMQENHNYNAALRNFLKFKLQRHELSGIFDNSVSAMLKEPDLEFRPDMRVRAYCNNVVQDCKDHYSAQLDETADYTFGSIGRLEKEYVPALMDVLCTYFTENPGKKFNLLLIGGCADKRRLNQIKEKIAQCGNVNLVLTGNLYPIPRQLVKHVDLFVSAAGSSAVSYYEMVPTVKINQATAMPLGIIGYDFELGENSNNQPLEGRSIIDCINMVMNDALAIDYVEDFEVSYYKRMHTEFDRQLQFGEGQNIGYYDDVLKVRYTDTVYKMCSVVCRIFGVKITYLILECIRKLVRGTSNA